MGGSSTAGGWDADEWWVEMVGARRVPNRRNGALTGSPFTITSARVRFEDVDQERRFFRQQLPLQRRVTRGVLAVVLLLIAAQWAMVQVLDGQSLSAASRWWLIGASAVTLVLLAGMWRDRGLRVTYRWLAAAAVLLPGLTGVVIAAGADVGVQPVLLVVAGVVVTYFTSRLDFVSTAAAALAYTAVTVPVWLLFAVVPGRTDVVYTLVATLFAHFVGIIEARRVHRELRVSFAQREDLKHLSAIDVLTGLANRRAFDDWIARVWATWQQSGTTPTVLMLDIDHFKRLNDTLGHAAGDVALRMVADSIRGALRKGNGHLVARYGGEEFVVLLPTEEHRVAHSIAERIGAAVRDSGIESAILPRDGSKPAANNPLTISIGIASARVSMERAQELVDAADRALYRAKDEGRNCVRCADEDEPLAAQQESYVL